MQFKQPAHELKILSNYKLKLIIAIFQVLSIKHNQKPLTNVSIFELKLIYGQLDQNCNNL
jgi:hypothetical protein